MNAPSALSSGRFLKLLSWRSIASASSCTTRENVTILGVSDHYDTDLMTIGRGAARGFFLKQLLRLRFPFAC
jgi:hypothetical protein